VVAGSIVYLLGYLVWVLNAFQNRLGFLPALDAQYFIAGAIPALLLYLMYRASIVSTQSVERFREWLYADSNPKASKILLKRWLLISYYLVFSLIPLMILLHINERLLLVVGMIWITLELIVHNSLMYHSKAFKSGRFSRRFTIGICIVVFGIITFMFYYFFLYRSLPQELGGVRPRCAYLDVAKEEISNETFALLAPTVVTQSTQPVVQSNELEVLYSGSGVLVVRSQGRVIELPRSAIHAINSCN
jgi:hypothetical protein